MNALITFLRDGVFDSGTQRMSVIQLDGTIIESLDSLASSNSTTFSGGDAGFSF